MAEEVIKTIENIDRLFSEIVVNGVSHVSDRYVSSTEPIVLNPIIQEEQESSQIDSEQPIEQATESVGEDVYAVVLNDTKHDFVDPDTVQNLSQEVTTRQNADNQLQQGINGLTGSVADLGDDIDSINDKIPNQASSTNQLADKDFVNSSIATNTANFLGTYTSLADIEAIQDPTNNDYVFLQTTDASGNNLFDRYKYNADQDEWLFEYELNNSSFTAEQWATINSGLTQQSVDEDIQEAISQVGSGIEVYDTEEEMEEDLPNKQKGDLVGTLSADEGELQDAPLGSVIPYLGTTDPTDGKWLVCDGRDTTGTAIELETHYPSLFMFLGGTNVLPDLREVTLVGAGENTTDTIADHDVYTVGQFKDDQIQNITGTIETAPAGDTPVDDTGAFQKESSTNSYWYSGGSANRPSVHSFDASRVARTGTTTHGKQKGVNYIIKAVSTVDYYHAPASEIAQIEQYFDNGMTQFLTQLNTWVDVSSDFSVVDSVAWANTPTSSLKVLYNAFQKKLKVWSWYNSTKSADSAHAFTLQYDGNNTDIVFDPTTTIAMQTLNKSYLGYDTTTNPVSAPNSTGFEGSYNIRTSNQIRLGGFCRNSGTGWGASICLVAEISL